MSDRSQREIAETYRQTAATFSTVVRGVTDWDAPTPVVEWRARDVVAHLVGWLPDVLGDTVTIASGPDDDPAAAWDHFDQQVQAILDDPASMQIEHRHQHTGTNPVPVVIDQIFTGDVFFHTWDLARSSGQDDTLDPARVHDALVGMRAAEAMLRPSGQFGQQQAVPADATEQEELFAFLGRDPRWAPPTAPLIE